MKNNTITVNGNIYDVSVEEKAGGSASAAPAPVAAPAPAPAPASSGAAGSVTVKAPMPGKILSVKASEGQAAVVTDEDGNRTPAPDGEYKTEDGKVITVVDGKVASITDDEAEVEARRQRFARIKAAFAESYEDKERKIAEAIAALGITDFWLVEAGADFAIAEVWKGEGYGYTRFAISWDAEGNAIATNPEEVVPAYVTEDEKAAAESAPSAEEVETLRNENTQLKA